MTEKTKEHFKPSDIWNRLSEDSQKICIYLGPLTATSTDRGFLEAMAGEEKVDLGKTLQELQSFNVLEKVTFVQELREKVKRFNRKAELEKELVSPESRELTDEEREYLMAKSNLERYERDPGRFKGWEEPRFRLQSDFKQHVVKLFEDLI